MLKDIFNALKNETKDEQTMAAGKQAAGAAMVADGLFGLENPLDGKEKRVGIGGALIMAGFGLIFMVGGYLVGRSMFQADDGDVVVTGVIVDFTENTRTRDGETSTMFVPVVEYTDPASGASYEIGTGWSSSSRPTIGDSVEVAFPPDNPAGGKVLSRTGSWISWGVVGVGTIIFLIGVGKFFVRLATIGFGVKLFLDGRRERKDSGDGRSVVEALVDGAQDVVDDVSAARQAKPSAPAQAGGPGVDMLLNQLADRGLGQASPTTVAVPGSAPPPPGSPSPSTPTRVPDPTTPPPGWYANPQGSGYRWWDGATWTDHVHPPPD